MGTQRITPCLWFDGNAVEAAEFYCSLFDGARVTGTTLYNEAGPGEPGSVVTVTWELEGTEYVGINGGPEFPFTEAVSFQVACEDQAEVDRLWTALTADGGQESVCGWLKDRFGLSWQIIPATLPALIGDPDPERARRATEAMYAMRKIDIAEVQRAADAVPTA